MDPISFTFSKNSNYWRRSLHDVNRQNISGWGQQTFENKKFVDITQQCFALLPQVNFPANNLNFYWRWRWWDWIQAIFLNLFYFTICPPSFRYLPTPLILPSGRADKWTKFMALYFEMTFRARVFYCLQTAGSPFFTIFRSIFLSFCFHSRERIENTKSKGSKGLSCHDLQVDERVRVQSSGNFGQFEFFSTLWHSTDTDTEGSSAKFLTWNCSFGPFGKSGQ